MHSYRSIFRNGVLLPALVLLVAGCCLSGREGQRFAGSADPIPLPDGYEIAEGVAVLEEEEAVAIADPIAEPEVAPSVPDAWEAVFRRLDASVFFDFDLAVLKATGIRILRNWVRMLKRYQQVDVVVSGHTDIRGTRDYNLWLGERRAKSVQDYLAIRGIAEKRVRIVSYGEEIPAVRGSSEEAHRLNRRAVLTAEAARDR